MKQWLCVLAMVLATGLNAAEKPDLTGKVMKADRTPLKNATVFIYTAGPKVGTGSICPSCYADCRKKAQTDAEGRFKIEALDPKLIFRLLVVGGGMQPKFVTKVDPATGPREVILEPVDDSDSGRASIRGMVMNPEGQPLFGAVLSVEGVEQGTGTRWGAVDRDADPVAVSDESGLFTLRCVKELTAVHALLEANGYAKRWVRLVPGRDHLLRAQSGVTVRGQLLSHGKPVPNGIVSMATIEREAGKHLHDFDGVTDENGRFAIVNVTPESNYYLFGKMESLQEAGALPLQKITAGRTDTTIDLGMITLVKSHTLRGRVVLPAGDAVPPKTRLFLGREDAWDFTETTLEPDGKFEFKGVPAESVSLNVRIRGYKMSHRNPGLDWLNGGIVGRVENDLNDFNIVMERGEWRYNEEEKDAPPETNRQPRDVPLRGVKL